MTVEEHNRVILRAVTISILGICVVLGIYLVRDVLITLYFSGLLAIGLSPAVRWIERSRLVEGRRKRIPRWLAILLLYLAFLAVLVIVAALVVPPLVTQIRQLITDMPTYADQMQTNLVARGWIQPGTSWRDLFSNMQLPSIAIAGIFSFLQSAVGAAGEALTILLLPFYLLLESGSLHGWMLAITKPTARPRVDRIMRSVTHKVGAWLGGQVLLCIIIGVTATIGFSIMGVPYFYVLGLLAGLGEFIPVIGPVLAAVPAVLLGWTVSPQTAVFVLVYTCVQQFIENNILVPRIMERQVGVSSVTIIVALLIGSSLMGLLGAILSIPTAAIIQVIIREHWEYERRGESH